MKYSGDMWMLGGTVASAIQNPSLLEALSKKEDLDPIVTRLVDALLETMQNPTPFEEALNSEKFAQILALRLQEAKEEGRAKGFAQSKLKGKIEIAVEMLKDGSPMDAISKYTKMPIEWVEQISSSL